MMVILQSIAALLISTLLNLFIWAVVIRFVLALSRADFYNQFSQFIVKITNPIIVPLRRLIPSVGKIDTASIVLALVLIVIKLMLLKLIGINVNDIALLPFETIAEFIRTVIYLYIIALILQMVISWIGNSASSPLTSILYSLTNPILRPIRNVIPTVGVIDFSPMAALLGLNILLIIVNGFGV